MLELTRYQILKTKIQEKILSTNEFDFILAYMYNYISIIFISHIAELTHIRRLSTCNISSWRLRRISSPSQKFEPIITKFFFHKRITYVIIYDILENNYSAYYICSFCRILELLFYVLLYKTNEYLISYCV